jgi:hypothetical protein
VRGGIKGGANGLFQFLEAERDIHRRPVQKEGRRGPNASAVASAAVLMIRPSDRAAKRRFNFMGSPKDFKRQRRHYA